MTNLLLYITAAYSYPSAGDVTAFMLHVVTLFMLNITNLPCAN